MKFTIIDEINININIEALKLRPDETFRENEIALIFKCEDKDLLSTIKKQIINNQLDNCDIEVYLTLFREKGYKEWGWIDIPSISEINPNIKEHQYKVTFDQPEVDKLQKYLKKSFAILTEYANFINQSKVWSTEAITVTIPCSITQGRSTFNYYCSWNISEKYLYFTVNRYSYLKEFENCMKTGRVAVTTMQEANDIMFKFLGSNPFYLFEVHFYNGYVISSKYRNYLLESQKIEVRKEWEYVEEMKLDCDWDWCWQFEHRSWESRLNTEKSIVRFSTLADCIQDIDDRIEFESNNSVKEK